MATVAGGARHRSLGVLLRNGAALLSVGAGAMHFAATPEHLEESMIAGLGLAMIAWLQVGWAMVLLTRPSRAVYLAGAVINVVVAFVWALSRTTGVPGVGGPEPVGIIDSVATVLELGAAGACAALLLPVVVTRRVPAAMVTGATLALVLMLAPLTMASFAAGGAETQAPDGGGSPESLQAAQSEDDDTSHSEHDKTSKDDKASTHTVKVTDNDFGPQNLKIAPGDTVKWVNQGKLPHTVTADTGDFDSGNMDAGDEFTFAFDKPGKYFYYCEYHGSAGRNGMWGSVTVADGKGPVPVHASKPPAPTSRGSSAPATASVSMGSSSFSPATVGIKVGDTVKWSNTSSLPHTVSADSGTFESGDMSAGSTFAFTFDQPGTYLYYCKFHGGPGGSGMAGKVVVTKSGSGSAPVVAGNGGQSAGGGNSKPAPVPPGSHKVAVRDDFFSPRSLTVRVGDTVTWANGGDAHTVTSNNGTFNSGELPGGDSFSFTFKNAGTFGYYCEFHGGPGEGMSGTIIVTKDGGGGGGGTTGGGNTGGGGGNTGDGGGGNAEAEEEMAEAREKCREEKAKAREDGEAEDLREARRRCREWKREARERD